MKKSKAFVDIGFVVFSLLFMTIGLIVGYKIGYNKGHEESEKGITPALAGCEYVASELNRQLTNCEGLLKGDE